MKKRIKYEDLTELNGEQLGEPGATLPKNFLPSIDQLIFKEKTKKITLEVGKNTFDFLKSEAKKRGGSYQRLIRNLLNAYVRELKNA